MLYEERWASELGPSSWCSGGSDGDGGLTVAVPLSEKTVRFSARMKCEACGPPH